MPVQVDLKGNIIYTRGNYLYMLAEILVLAVLIFDRERIAKARDDSALNQERPITSGSTTMPRIK